MGDAAWAFAATVSAALLGAVALVLVAKLNTIGNKVEKTVEQTTSTGNGYAKDTKDALTQIRESLRQVHRRLDQQNAHTQRRDDHVDGLLVRLDDRLTHIEENI